MAKVRSDIGRSAAVIRLAVGRLSRRLRQEAGWEVTPSQASVLATIARDGPVTPSMLADRERLSRPTVTKIVGKLRELGLVETEADSEDGRSYWIRVSDDGSALRRLRQVRKESYLERMLRNADAGQVELLVQAATVLLALLDETDP